MKINFKNGSVIETVGMDASDIIRSKPKGYGIYVPFCYGYSLGDILINKNSKKLYMVGAVYTGWLVVYEVATKETVCGIKTDKSLYLYLEFDDVQNEGGHDLLENYTKLDEYGEETDNV